MEKGIAVRIDVKTITSNTLYETLNEMLSNPMYKENVKILSRCFKDQKELPLNRAIWWIEWTLRNPSSMLMNRGKNLNFVQIQSIDVIAVLTVITIAFVCAVLLLLKKAVSCLFRRTDDNVNKMKND